MTNIDSLNIVFTEAKNGEKNICVNNIFLHSTYNPSSESTRFADSIKISYNPKVLIIFEPGFDYLYPLLKNKFPGCKIGKISIIKELNNAKWDFCFNYSSIEHFTDYLKSNFSEEELLSTILLNWPSALKLFPDEAASVALRYKQAMEYAKTVLVTRQYFEKKWFLNSLNFFKYLNSYAAFSKNKLNCPVIITASGPSLTEALPLLQKYNENCFIIALSSSLSVLYKNNIVPDLILSTDGGYYAAQHLKKTVKFTDIPLGLTTEAFCQKSTLHQNIILPLFYNDSPFLEIIKESKIPFYEVQRNGTISGTALKFAQKLTDSNIYFCGLDLIEQKGFQHTQPNELELNSCKIYNKLQTSELKNYRSSLPNISLKIYADWFASQSDCSNVFRIIEEKRRKNSLNKISDINCSDFELALKKIRKTDKNIFEINKISRDQRILINNLLKDFYKNILKDNTKLSSQLFPIDNLSIFHATNEDSRIQADNLLKSKLNELLIKAGKIIND